MKVGNLGPATIHEYNQLSLELLAALSVSHVVEDSVSDDVSFATLS